MAGYLDWILAHSMPTLNARFQGIPPAPRGQVDTGGVPLGDGTALPVNDPFGGVMGASADPFANAPVPPVKNPGLQQQAPIPFGGMLSSAGVLGMPGGIPLDAPPSTNDPQSGEPEVMRDGVPLPRPKPLDATADGQPIRAPMSLAPPAEEDLSARTRPEAATGTPTVMPPSAPSAGSRFLSGLSNALNNNSSTLLALGSGFAGAPSFGTGMSRAFAAAAPAAAVDRANALKQTGIQSTYAALVARGVPPAEALAAVYNPDVMKATAARYFEMKPRAPHQIGADIFGNPIQGSFDPNTGKYYDVQGQELGGSSNDLSARSMAQAGLGGGDLNKGVTSINGDLTGDAYLNQFSPEIQQAVKAYVDGRSMPTGIPRKGFTQTIKMIASKYGSDVGQPVDDSTFTARRTMRNSLSNATAGSLGGQINFGNTAITHLDDLGKKALELGNWDVGIAPLSTALNEVRGLTSAQRAKMDALRGAAQHYGQEITKFYAGSPGGSAERNRFMSSVDAAKTPQQLASVLETEAELIHGRMQSLRSQIEGTLGARGAADYPVIRPDAEKALAGINESVRKLRGDTAAAPAAGAPTLKPGESTTINGVTIRRLN